MQHGPGRVVAAQAYYALKAKRIHSLLLVGHAPDGSEPDAQLRFGSVEYRSGRYACLVLAAPAHQATAGCANWLVLVFNKDC
jgi:hypothetical protein